jgi:hypothetical protein
MAEGRIKKTGAGEAPLPTTPEQFRATPEFRRFKRGMKRLLRVSKAELDRRVNTAKEKSTRAGNPGAPGRKPLAKRRT